MAQDKYELLTQAAEEHKRIKQQPWFKERLQTKYRKSAHRKGIQKPCLLQTSSWTFLKSGIDDFRDGTPACVAGPFLCKKQDAKYLSPPQVGVRSEAANKSPNAAVPSRLTRNEQVYQRTLPQWQRRRDKVEVIEESFLEHPLALFPHLEDSVPPDLFENIIEILDPAMNLRDSSSEDGEVSSEEQDDHTLQRDCKTPKQWNRASSSCEPAFDFNSTPFRLVPGNPLSAAKDTTKLAKIKEASAAQEREMKEVTGEFCKWIKDLGGDENNIEEATVNSLFASGYETKPALSIPIRVVELTNVPPELRSEDPLLATEAEFDRSASEEDRQSYQPSWVKVKYGAWYLNPNTWKARPADTPLQDPKEARNKQDSISKQKSKELDKVLATIHGAKAFKDFVDHKGKRNPEFLKSVSLQCESTSTERERGMSFSAGLKQRGRSITRTSSLVPISQ